MCTVYTKMTDDAISQNIHACSAVYTKSDKDVITTRHRQQVLLPLHSKCAHCTPQWIFQQSADAISQNIQACSRLTNSLKCENHKQEGIFFAVVNCWCHFPEYLKEVSSRCFKINLKVKARHRQQVLLPLHYEYALYTPKWIIQQSDDANSHNFQACSILKESLKCNNHKQEGIFLQWSNVDVISKHISMQQK